MQMKYCDSTFLLFDSIALLFIIGGYLANLIKI